MGTPNGGRERPTPTGRTIEVKPPTKNWRENRHHEKGAIIWPVRRHAFEFDPLQHRTGQPARRAGPEAHNLHCPDRAAQESAVPSDKPDNAVEPLSANGGVKDATGTKLYTIFERGYQGGQI